MEHTIYRSIEEMTQPETLTALVGQPITKTCLEPFKTAGWSSTESQFLIVDKCDVEQPRYILKRIRRDQDWVMQATEDRHWRAITIWKHGLLDRLPKEIDHGIIACTFDEEGYAILMHNSSHALLRVDIQLSEEDHVTVLDGMAALHAAFWEDSMLTDPKLNLCKPEDFFTHTSPEKARRIVEKNPSQVLEMILEGWLQVPNFIDAEIADLMRSLVHDPSPLCDALASFPKTLVHSDVHRANLGIERAKPPRLIMLDWARPTPTVPAVDLVYYLVMNSSAHLPISFEKSIDLYKQRLLSRLGDRFDESWWQPQLELSLLGVFAEAGCFKAWFAAHSDDEVHRLQDRADLEWWSEQAHAGAKWLVS